MQLQVPKTVSVPKSVVVDVKAVNVAGKGTSVVPGNQKNKALPRPADGGLKTISNKKRPLSDGSYDKNAMDSETTIAITR